MLKKINIILEKSEVLYLRYFVQYVPNYMVDEILVWDKEEETIILNEIIYRKSYEIIFC